MKTHKLLVHISNVFKYMYLHLFLYLTTLLMVVIKQDPILLLSKYLSRLFFVCTYTYIKKIMGNVYNVNRTCTIL